MTYTVKQLAKLSGVSVRTLHWYDEKKLLTLAYHGANGYRYYKEKQLLTLQQILFFKELGFNLNDIQILLSQNDFDNVETLKKHKKTLTKEINRKQKLISTINKTILHLEGKEHMTNKELYHGFDSAKQNEYEQHLVKEYGNKAENLIQESKKRTSKWGKDEWDDVKSTGDQIYKELTSAIDSKLHPECNDVQKIIHRHYHLQNKFYDVTQEIYVGLATLYIQNPDFKKFFDAYHLKLAKYIGDAMRYYATHNL